MCEREWIQHNKTKAAVAKAHLPLVRTVDAAQTETSDTEQRCVAQMHCAVHSTLKANDSALSHTTHPLLHQKNA